MELDDQVDQTLQALLVENASLKKQQAEQAKTLMLMAEKNVELAEFIRIKLSDILALAKDFRDTYTAYVEFTTAALAKQSPGELDDKKKDTTVRLGDSEL